jgi:arylsulfate sulfotransferase
MSLKTLGSYLILFVVLYASGCSNQSNLPITITVSPSTSALAPGQTVQLSATVVNNSSGTESPATTDASSTAIAWATTTGSIDANGNYTAPSGASSTTAYVTATSKQDRTKYGYATIHIVAKGTVATTANPQVALYTVNPGSAGNVSVQFGTTTSYGLTTWTQPSTGTPIGLFVAGMKANVEYHMRGVVQFSDGTQFNDADQTFTPNVSQSDLQAPNITATTTPGMTPQSGVELLDLVTGTARPAVADLAGNVLWTYTAGPNGPAPNPIKLLPNGHFLINFSNTAVDGQDSVMQEIDLTGKLYWQMTAADLNKALASATCSGCNITVTGTHHDFVLLPNNHLIVLAGTQQVVSGTTVTGDVVIDLDQNRNPVWLWNEFDHLDINRRPYLYPDWTHSNALVYSADDGNLLVSIRHQSWIVKVNYANGQGDGSIIWHLGYQGDFTLVGGTDPVDWFYAQHGPSFASSNSTGTFSLILFDNGDDRVFPAGVTCGSTGAPPCLYSTVPVFQIDETNMTATLLSNMTSPNYSFFGGNAAVLANGNIEFCESAGGPGGNVGTIYEFTQGASPQQVWVMQTGTEYAYRGQRIPSMYPGVQW